MSDPQTMRLRVLTPTAIVVDAEVTKVVAEGQGGSFGLLPRHVDTAAALVPGLLAYTEAGTTDETVLAVDSGALVKYGRQVDVATIEALRGGDAADLRQQLEQAFLDLDEREQRSRAALARLESDLTAQLIELEHE
jgi:F-type H+-transporting ATPase subunit epsilon